MTANYLPLWTAGIFLAFSLLTSCDDDNNRDAKTRTYLLIHGASHGAWAWHKVVPILQREGHHVVAIDLPSHGDDNTSPENVTLDDYANKVADIANAQPGPVILVGHSSGGVTIARAAELLGLKKVEKLIFLDAFLPKDGESIFSLAAKFLPTNPGDDSFTNSFRFDSKGATFTLDTASVAKFLYHDCSAADITFAKKNLGKQPVKPFATPVHLSDDVYGAIPKYYIVCSEARNGNMSEMSKNVPMTRTESLPTSHSPFFSQPEALVNLIARF